MARAAKRERRAAKRERRQTKREQRRERKRERRERKRERKREVKAGKRKVVGEEVAGWGYAPPPMTMVTREEEGPPVDRFADLVVQDGHIERGASGGAGGVKMGDEKPPIDVKA